MKLSNKFRIFRKQEGFTLVELIVVIAIVAILGGVAVPAYTGYIEKADAAADAQLLADVNKAFAAACMVEGIDNYNNDNVPGTLTISEDRTLPDIEIAGVDGFKDTFKDFYEGGKFKKTTKLEYRERKGGFVDPETEETKPFKYAGVTMNIAAELIEMIKDSTWMNAVTLGGTDGLLDKIADVSDFASVIMGQSGTASDLLNSVIGSQDFKVFAATALGIDPSDAAAFEAKDAELIAAIKAKDPSITTDTEARNKYMTNAAVLFAANQATTMSKEDIMASLTNQDVKGNIITTMDSNTTSAFSQATLAYGMYTSWAHATGNTEAQKKDELDVMNDLNNAEFQAWLTTDDAQRDLDAYLAALKVVNTSSQNADAVSSVVVNGFSDSELKGAVNGLFG